MEIRYISYEEEILDGIEAGHIHVFEKNEDKMEARRRYRGDIFDRQPLFLSISEFKGNLFLSDRITIKEEKQVIAFYRALSQEHRRRLKVEGYYDVIDIAANFFNFFRMLIEYRIEEVDNLKEWQRGIYDLFCSIRENYLELLEDKGYTDSVFIGADDNFTEEVYGSYRDREIIIYNKLYFTPREKWIVERLEEAGYRIVLRLQMERGEFDEETWRVKNISYRGGRNKKLSIYRGEDDFTLLMKTLETAHDLSNREKRYKIYDANNEKYKYNAFFDEVVYLSEIPIFRVIEMMHILLAGAMIEDGVDLGRIRKQCQREEVEKLLQSKLLVSMQDIIKCSEISEFRRYYSLDERDLSVIKYLASEGYKYITRDEIIGLGKRLEEGEKKSGFTREDFIRILEILDEVIEIYQIDTLKEWCEKLTFTREVMMEFSEHRGQEIKKYFEALSEVEIIEELDLIGTRDDGVKRWEDFFGRNISEGLLRLIMKYHRFKEVAAKGHKLKKDGVDKIPTTREEARILLNISDIFVPENKGSAFLLTENQKKELGIRNIDDDRMIERYNILRSVMTTEEVYVLALENQGANSSLSPFIEEIAGERPEGVEVTDERIGVGTENYLELMEEVMEKTAQVELEVSPEDRELDVDLSELLKKKNISAYMCDELFNCRYKMYLRYVLRLEREELEVDDGLTRREYGNLAHDIFEEVLTRYLKEQKNYKPLMGQSIDVEKIYDIAERLIDQESRRLKLPNQNGKYYKEIIYRNLAEGVRRFFREISRKLQGEEVVDILIEEYGQRLIEKGLYQSAKGDLIIETDRGKHIIDFKTGGKIERQLDYYGILYTGSPEGARRYIYSIDKNLLEEAEKVTMTREDLINEVEDLWRSRVYERNYSSRCKRCQYWVVCKEVEGNV